MKVIYLGSGPLIPQMKKDLFIDEISKCLDVEFWNFKELSNISNYSLPDEINDYTNITSISEFKYKVRELKSTDHIFITPMSIRSLGEIIEVILNNKSKIVHLEKGILQNHLIAKSNFIRYNKTRIKKHLKTLLNFDKIKFSYVLKSPGINPLIPFKKSKIIHHVKYDEYLEAITEKPLVNIKYAVFLDSYMPYHQDILVHWKQQSIDPKIYFEKMNSLFDKIERKYKVKIIISAHPKAEYDKKVFKGRQIIKYKTPNLIHYSEFVISHASTSVFNAVLSSKPILFVYYNEMLEKGTRAWTISTIEYAKYLKSSLINLDCAYGIDIKHNEKVFEKFKYKYLIDKKNKSQRNSEIITNWLKNLN